MLQAASTWGGDGAAASVKLLAIDRTLDVCASKDARPEKKTLSGMASAG